MVCHVHDHRGELINYATGQGKTTRLPRDSAAARPFVKLPSGPLTSPRIHPPSSHRWYYYVFRALLYPVKKNLD